MPCIALISILYVLLADIRVDHCDHDPGQICCECIRPEALLYLGLGVRQRVSGPGWPAVVGPLFAAAAPGRRSLHGAQHSFLDHEQQAGGRHDHGERQHGGQHGGAAAQRAAERGAAARGAAGAARPLHQQHRRQCSRVLLSRKHLTVTLLRQLLLLKFVFLPQSEFSANKRM